MIELEENEALLAEYAKTKGLIQVDKQFLVNVAMTNLKNWTDVWRNVRQQYDFDKNGFVAVDELSELFYQYFPAQLEGKTMARYFKSFLSTYDKTLINYKSVREEINSEISKRLNEIQANPTDPQAELEAFSQKPLNVDNLSRLNSVRNFDENGLLQSHVGTASVLESQTSRLTKSSINLLGKSNSVAKLKSIIDQKQIQSHLGFRNDDVTTTLKRTIDLVPKENLDPAYDSKREADSTGKKSRRSVILNTIDQ